jgi:hypothetical protein
MQRNPVAGWALIASVVMGLITMANHPTGLDVLGVDAASQARLSVFVHVLSLAALPLSLLGAVAITRRLAAARELSAVGFISYALSVVAVMSAAVFSGLVTTPIAAQLRSAEETAKPLLRTLMSYSGLINHAYASTYVGFSSAALLFWGVAMVRTRAFPEPLGYAGATIGAATVVLLFAGHIQMDVHGFGAVVLAQGVWLIACGVLLIRREAPQA